MIIRQNINATLTLYHASDLSIVRNMLFILSKLVATAVNAVTISDVLFDIYYNY